MIFPKKIALNVLSSSSSKKSPKSRQSYDLEFKRRVVQEYISGKGSAQEIANREGLIPGQIYRWRVQLDEQAKVERVEQIQTQDPGLTIEQARRIRELEEELLATQKKMAQLAVENECLGEFIKKTFPSSPYAKKSSSFIEVSSALARSKGRVK